MSKISHFSIANVQEKPFLEFFKIVQQEIATLSDAKSRIIDVVFSGIGEGQAVATIYFVGEKEDDQFSMRHVTFVSSAQTSRQALWKNMARVQQWVESQDSSVTIYDTTTQFNINEDGKDEVKTVVYFDTASHLN